MLVADEKKGTKRMKNNLNSINASYTISPLHDYAQVSISGQNPRSPCHYVFSHVVPNLRIG